MPMTNYSRRANLVQGSSPPCSRNVVDLKSQPVLHPAGNKVGLVPAEKVNSKPLRKTQRDPEARKQARTTTTTCVLQRKGCYLFSNLSPNASCSSDASSDSLQNGAPVKQATLVHPVKGRRTSTTTSEKLLSDKNVISSQGGDAQIIKKRCAWVTSHADPYYVTFHDEEWGVPVHEDKKLFELLVLSGALAELTWPAILGRRQSFREVFLDFEPTVVAKLNEKKILMGGSTASKLLSESKLHAVVENACQVSKIITEFGSFDNYIWNFVNYKPITSGFRYPHQVPVKTAKADAISKDLIRRGLRCVGPTVIYSFMQAAGLTNDHLCCCYRFQECALIASCMVLGPTKSKDEGRNAGDVLIDLSKSMDELAV